MPHDTLTKQAVLESSLSNILVADSSKFGVAFPSYFADLSAFDTAVSDSGIDQESADEIRRRGIELIIA